MYRTMKMGWKPALALALLLLASPVVSADTTLRVDQDRIERHISELSAFGRNPEGGVSRVAFSQADLDAREYIKGLMIQAGLNWFIDPAGNLIGHRAGSEKLPPILIGSHIDSVPGGGNYDGDVGVIGAIEVARVLHAAGIVTRHPLEVVVFADEEGGLSGSRGMVGKLGPQALETASHSSLTIAEGLKRIGGDPEHLSQARRAPGDVTAFLELHIEQGAVLDETGTDIGVVTGIVGIRWWDVIIEGVANHAGTTPMNQRHDALLTAAELVQAINRVITGQPGTQVGTVGRISAEPGAPNVIPGKVVMSLEIRDLSMDKVNELFREIELKASEIATQHGTQVQFQRIDFDAEPALTDPRIRKLIADEARALGFSSIEMPSGAGHDAQDLAQVAPTGMIFVPSVGGISHAPNEFTRPEDMANGANVLLRAVLAIDQGALGQ